MYKMQQSIDWKKFWEKQWAGVVNIRLLTLVYLFVFWCVVDFLFVQLMPNSWLETVTVNEYKVGWGCQTLFGAK